ncbi:hypothetical protein [Schlesneria sp. T3-172]|uniref:hypothetical protein n=1 Tax=Schlesneria sphaerica TaxID=3373610 RepID=UPI0037CA9F09
MPAHRIQLKGPWEVFPPQVNELHSDAEQKPETHTMPKEWRELFGDQGGTARFQRKFHRPSNLEPHERIFLAFSGIRGETRIRLNQRQLGEFDAQGGSIEVEVTSNMNSFNTLEVEIDFDPGQSPGLPGGLFGVVALEIRWDDLQRN